MHSVKKPIRFKTDLYLTPKLSVGATFVGNDGEADIKGNDLGEFRQAWGGNVNYFITPALAVGASYMKADVKSLATIHKLSA